MTGVRGGELESAAAMVAALQRGAVTAVELVERSIARAEAWQPSINAFSQLWGEDAVERARGIDAEPPGRRSGPMAGVPIAVKDLFDVAGRETTGCSAAYLGTIAKQDAPIIERIRRARDRESYSKHRGSRRPRRSPRLTRKRRGANRGYR